MRWGAAHLPHNAYSKDWKQAFPLFPNHHEATGRLHLIGKNLKNIPREERRVAPPHPDGLTALERKNIENNYIYDLCTIWIFSYYFLHQITSIIHQKISRSRREILFVTVLLPRFPVDVWWRCSTACRSSISHRDRRPWGRHRPCRCRWSGRWKQNRI